MKWVFAGIALAAAVFGATPAFGQINKQGGPIEVGADKAEAMTDQGRYIYTKNVVVTQGDARLKTDKLTIVCTVTPAPVGAAGSRSSGQACDEMQSLVAEGSVYYLTPDGKIRGDRAVYDYAAKVITVTGDVILSRDDGSVVNGTQLIYEVDAGKAVMTSSNGKGVFSYFNPQSKKNAAPAPVAPVPSPALTAPPPG
jgi:lipopolysaccharide export system protein LptA